MKRTLERLQEDVKESKLATSKEMGTPDLQLQGNKFCQQP